jgi:hypothetical protein
MKRTILLSAGLLVVLISIYSQKLQLNAGIGVCNSNMKDLQEVQNQRLSQIEVPGQITEDFPATLQYIGEARLRINKLYIGLYGAYTSTGSRISYGDYSGQLNMDVICNSFKIGPSLTYSIICHKIIDFNIFLITPISFTNASFRNYIEIDGDVQTDVLDLYSKSLGALPGLEVLFKISIVNIGLNAGYMLDAGGFLHDKHDRNTYLLDANNDKVYTNWSGYNVSLKFGVNLFNNKSE